MKNLISQVDFSNTKVAFESQNSSILWKNYNIFRLMNQNWLVNIGTFFIKISLKFGLPVKKIIKDTVFGLFCGGESISECENTIQILHKFNVGTILDYSVEGEDDEQSFEFTKGEIIKSILYAKDHKDKIPFSVFKITGIGSRDLLTKIQDNKESLNEDEKKKYEAFKNRLNTLAQTAFDHNMRLFIDAEETWIQNVIDDLVLDLMRKHNTGSVPIIFNTYQLYRTQAYGILKNHIETGKSEGFKIGAKLVRGAYMEKERDRAQKYNYADPINASKELTDREFNNASILCIENADWVSVCIGTHNEESNRVGVEYIEKKGLDVGDQRVYFAQLLGMSDNITFNLAKAGFNTAKYVPFGPVESVMPYLFRRAEENSSIAGQTSREYKLFKKEIDRRKRERV